MTGTGLTAVVCVAAEVGALTRTMRTAIEGKLAWLEEVQRVTNVDKQSLRTARVQAKRAPPRTTVEDVEIDFPDGPFQAPVDDADDAEDDEGPADGAADGDDVVMVDGGPAQATAGDDAELATLVQDAVAFGSVGDVTDDMVDAADEPEDVVRDAIEAEMLSHAPANASTAADPGPPEAAVPPDVAASGDPRGRAVRIVSAAGDCVKVHLSHRASLAVLQNRVYHVHVLTLHPRTRETVVTYPRGMRVPKGEPSFSVDLLTVAHSAGIEVLQRVRAVLFGDLPVIPARFTHMPPRVQQALRETGMCIVVGCMLKAVMQTSYRRLHLCDTHLKATVKVHGTDAAFRVCTACKDSLPEGLFRDGMAAEITGGMCEPCRLRQQGRRRAAEGAEQRVPVEGSPAPLQPADEAGAPSAACGAGAAPTEAAADDAPVGVSPSRTELENARDEDGVFVRERRTAAQLLRQDGGDTRQGESMEWPLLTHAAHHPARANGPQRCVRVGCCNPSRHQRIPTLCAACVSVCPSSHACCCLCGCGFAG